MMWYVHVSPDIPSGTTAQHRLSSYGVTCSLGTRMAVNKKVGNTQVLLRGEIIVIQQDYWTVRPPSLGMSLMARGGSCLASSTTPPRMPAFSRGCQQRRRRRGKPPRFQHPGTAGASVEFLKKENEQK
jgi:hypothetical protein